MLQTQATVPAESAAPGTAWYVCLTKPRQEAMAARHIQEQGYDFYMPTLRRWQRRASGWRCKDEVLFPRYAFARPGRAGQGVGPLRSTPGVTTLVRFGPVLAQMPDQHLQAVRQVVAASAQGLPQHPLQPGQHVVFVEGPLKGLQGLVSAVASQRVQLMLTLLGRQQTINVPMRILAAA